MSTEPDNRQVGEAKIEETIVLDVPPGQGPLLLFVGRLQPLKGPDVAIRTLAEVRRRVPAARLLIEMRDKLSGTALAPTLGAPATGPAASELRDDNAPGDATGIARQALVALGYKPAEADRLLRGLAGEGVDSETLIREALKRAVR